MKRLSLYLFLILFTLPTPSQADDIRDFQIEGMSIGDSLLDYYSEKEIKKSILKSNYKDKSFIRLRFAKNFDTYKSIHVHIKDNDSKYIIHMIAGTQHFKDDMNGCEKQKKKIEQELKSFFKNAEIKNLGKIKHGGDSSGKSTVSTTSFKLANMDYVAVSLQCYDWSKKMKYIDHLRVKFMSKDYYYWIVNKAYK